MAKTLNDYFDRVYLLNLTKRKDRLAQATEELNRVGIKFSRWSATPGGMIGCVQSYGSIFQHCLNMDFNNVLILEDDVVFESMDIEGLEELPKNWSIVYFGGWSTTPLTQYSKHLKRAKGVLCCHAVAYNRNVFHDLALTFQNTKEIRHRKQHNDEFLARVIQPIYPCFLLDPPIATQREGYSDNFHRYQSYPINNQCK